METLLNDARYGLRMLRRTPAFTLVAVVALALGIGANSAIFSFVDAVILRPLPYADPDRLVFLWESSPQLENMSVAYPNFLDWRAQTQTFESMAARQGESFNLTGVEDPERVEGSNVSASLFPLLGATPLLGRTFTEEEDRAGAPNVLVISHSFWQRRFQGDSQIVGRKLLLNDEPYTVIGVMRPGFRYPPTALKADIYAALGRNADRLANRGNHPGIYAVGRLKQGATLEQARAEFDAIARRLAEQYPASNKNSSVGMEFMHKRLVRNMRTALLVLMAAVGFVLLIACANVANLLLGRAAARQQEIALRAALGAGRARLIRQLLTESVLLALASGVAGLAIGWAGIRGLIALLPEGTAFIERVALDARVVLFAFALSLLTGVFFGLFPALQISRSALHDTLKEGSRRSSRRQGARSALVVVEMALSLVLLAGAGLMVQSFLKIWNSAPGFNPQGLLTFYLGLPQTAYGDEIKRAAFFERLVEQLRTAPGVMEAAVVTPLPMSGDGWQTSIRIEGCQYREHENLLTDIARVTPQYFRTMGIPILKGRAFTHRDRQGAQRVAIIDETFARQQFPDEDPIGKRFRIGSGTENPLIEIVGIAGHVKNYGIDQESRIETYLPFWQSPLPWGAVVVRASSDPLRATGAARAEVAKLDRNLPIYNVRAYEQMVEDAIAQKRLATVLLGMFSALAVLLAAVGLYGVISFSVTQRTHEIGIRMALGAAQGDVLGMIVRQGARLALAGLAIGLAGAFGLTRLMATMLFGVKPADPLTFSVVAFLLGMVALAASYLPARRATRVQPVAALRYE